VNLKYRNGSFVETGMVPSFLGVQDSQAGRLNDITVIITGVDEIKYLTKKMRY
jgi:hypothetical protein